MENENAEYSEVRCKTLILGDEETGFINLKVSKIDDSPCLEIESNEGNEDSSITIGFNEGKPIIQLTSHDADKKENTISLSFNDDGLPIFELATNCTNEDGFDSGFSIGFSDGRPMLGLISNHDEQTSIASLFIDDQEISHLVLANERIKGGLVAMRAGNDGASLIVANYKDIIDAADGQLRGKGILLVNNSELTLMDIKGHTIGGRNIQEENNSSKGENNE